MLIVRILIFLFLSFISLTSINAQDKKAFNLFEDGFYKEVAKYYEAKHLEKEDAILLCKALLQIGDNDRALKISSKLYAEQPNNEAAFTTFYQALTYDRRYSEAYELVEKDKNKFSAFIADSLTRDIEKFMVWQYDIRDIEAQPVKNINTENSEYSPYYYKSRLYYCILKFNPSNGQESYDLAESKISGKDHKKDTKSSFSLGSLKSSNHINIGPFCIWEKTIYYTVSTKNFKGVNNLKIIKASIDDKGKITEETELEICAKSYSVAHPTISEDGLRLYFSSDMPGGYGGMDLYVSYKTTTGWGQPINMGNWVNTTGNEVFPHYHSDHIYFSSDKLDSYGGLDIFSVHDDDNLENVVNLKYPINTPFDDFGISLINENTGHFSSNRPGNEGNDDIYSFNLRIPDQKPKITGIMAQKGIPIGNTEIHLVDLDGNILEVVTTDENGAFIFDRQPDPGKFGIQIAQPLESNSNVSLSLTDEAGNVKDKLTMNSKGVFVFEMFALDEVDELSLFSLYETDPYMINLYGVVYREVPGDLEGIYNIEIQDSDNNELKYIKTNESSRFSADELPYGERFLMQIESSDPQLKMAITDDENNVIQDLFSPGNNLFAYQHIGNPDDLVAMVDKNKSTNIVMKNESIKIPNIYYAYGSFKLNSKAKKSLDDLAQTLKNSKGITIELLSHTDTRGTASSNVTLSQQRAKSAKNYLVKKGVNATRILAKGYGWNKLMIDCESMDCSEADHAQNRRTEFQIISN
ncbi:MAG: outer membrane protein OmpA-like peptidoglycan-associated protein [Glaciecola sp.]|jgi:outer membrane protein OmpA-like peptidoglycan-associated protein